MKSTYITALMEVLKDCPGLAKNIYKLLPTNSLIKPCAKVPKASESLFYVRNTSNSQEPPVTVGTTAPPFFMLSVNCILGR